MTTAIDYTCATTVRCGVFPHDRMAMAGAIYAISAHVEVTNFLNVVQKKHGCGKVTIFGLLDISSRELLRWKN